MFFVLFILWLVFNARITLEIVLVGLVLSAVLTAFGRKVCGWSSKADRIGIRLFFAGICYFASLIVEIFKANFAVMRIILSPKENDVKPQLFFFDSKLKTVPGKMALGNSITITPGTYTIGLYESTIAVHALNDDFASGTPDSAFNKKLLEMEANVTKEEGK